SQILLRLASQPSRMQTNEGCPPQLERGRALRARSCLGWQGNLHACRQTKVAHRSFSEGGPSEPDLASAGKPTFTHADKRRLPTAASASAGPPSQILLRLASQPSRMQTNEGCPPQLQRGRALRARSCFGWQANLHACRQTKVAHRSFSRVWPCRWIVPGLPDSYVSVGPVTHSRHPCASLQGAWRDARLLYF